MRHGGRRGQGRQWAGDRGIRRAGSEAGSARGNRHALAGGGRKHRVAHAEFLPHARERKAHQGRSTEAGSTRHDRRAGRQGGGVGSHSTVLASLLLGPVHPDGQLVIGSANKKAPRGGAFRGGDRPSYPACVPMTPFILVSAFASICRTRSADTPNSAARSCSVAPSFSVSQRASTMRRLRASRLLSAFSRPTLRNREVSSRSSRLAGSAFSAARYAIGL